MRGTQHTTLILLHLIPNGIFCRGFGSRRIQKTLPKRKRLAAAKMEDEWGLTMEELDSLEKDAFRKLADRHKPSSAQGNRVIPSTVLSSPSKRTSGQVAVKIFNDRPGRIALETQYNQHLVAVLKSIVGHEWDQLRRVWTYPEGQLENIAKALSLLPQIVASIHAVPPLNLPSACGAREYESGLPSPKERSPAKFQSSQDYECRKSSPYRPSDGSPQTQKNCFAVQIYLINEDRIAIRSTYNERVKEACQSVAGRHWNAEEKVWTFPKNALDDLLYSLDMISSLSIAVEAISPLVLPDSWASRTLGSWKLVQSDLKSGKAPSARQSLWQEEQHVPESDPKKNMQKLKVRIFLHGSGKIAAKFEYQQQLVAAFRAIPNSEWFAKERLWMFPVSSLAVTERTLSQVDAVAVDVESLDPFVRHALEAASALPNLLGMYDNMPAYLETQLLPFQRDGVRFVLEHGGRALIADEMGLGKTLQAIAVVSCLKDAWPVLVITPSALRLQWALMIEQWLKIRSSEILVVMSQWSGSKIGNFNIVQTSGKQTIQLDGVFNIISYELVSKIQEILVNSDFKIVIADESHYMKNPQAKRTNASIPLFQKAQYRILLSGTPALSRPIELFKQLEALYPTVYNNIHQYGQRYCMGGIFGKYQGASNREELHALMKKTIMIRRLKKDVLSELPVKRRQQIFLSLEDKGLKQMRALFSELGAIKRDINVCKSDEEAQSLKYSENQLINKIYTESAEVKIPTVLEFLGTMIEASCKFLIFSHHQSMMDAIEQFVVKKNVGYIRIDGSTPASSRQTLVTKFQDREDIKVAVLSIRAAGIGVTLTAASTVIFAELSWTPGDLVQAEDRAHRIGQVSSVNVYYLHANDTVDDIIWKSVQHKLENLGQVLDGREDALEASTSQHYTSCKGQRKLTSFLQPCTNNNPSTITTDQESGGEELDSNSDDSRAHKVKKFKS